MKNRKVFFVVFLIYIIVTSGGCGNSYKNKNLNDVKLIFAGTEDDADCAILLSKNKCTVIDTGEKQDIDHIIQILKANQVSKIDYLILTHPDKDHVGGGSGLIQKFSVQKVIIPYCLECSKEKKAYGELLQQIERLNIPLVILTRVQNLKMEEIEIKLYPPNELHYDKTNNYSIALLIKHGDVNIFMAGDAEKKRMKELMQLELPNDIDLYKTAHHGRNSAQGVEFIEKISPQMAVVTAAKPENDIKNAFQAVGTEVYTTIGTDLTFLSDGSSLTLEIPKE